MIKRVVGWALGLLAVPVLSGPVAEACIRRMKESGLLVRSALKPETQCSRVLLHNEGVHYCQRCSAHEPDGHRFELPDSDTHLLYPFEDDLQAAKARVEEAFGI